MNQKIKMADNYTTEQLNREKHEVEIWDAIKHWQLAGYGDEALLNLILEAHPSLILNMKARVKNDQ